jgi:hypothetical protein
MLRRVIRVSVVAGLFVAAGMLTMSSTAWAQQAVPDGGGYYVPAGSEAGIASSMYPSPRWTPPVVGHTNITYAPLAPHEFLYTHSEYHRDRAPCGGGVTTTHAHYGHFAMPNHLHRFFCGPKR